MDFNFCESPDKFPRDFHPQMIKYTTELLSITIFHRKAPLVIFNLKNVCFLICEKTIEANYTHKKKTLSTTAEKISMVLDPSTARTLGSLSHVFKINIVIGPADFR